MDHATEIAAILHATSTPDDPNPGLAAKGYHRWRDPAGAVRVLQRRPSIGGPWTREDLGEPSPGRE